MGDYENNDESGILGESIGIIREQIKIEYIILLAVVKHCYIC